MRKSLHVITTGRQSVQTLTAIMKEIHHSIDALHIREKNWSASAIVEAIKTLVHMGMPSEKIIVNDRVDIAHMLQTKGVHLAGHSMNVDCVKMHFPSLQAGCSVHSLQEGVEAEAKGADYLLYGHIFKTTSKPGIAPRGVESLRQLKETVTIPVIAIGGMTPENTVDVLRTGTAGIAVLSGILLADDPKEAITNYRNVLW